MRCDKKLFFQNYAYKVMNFHFTQTGKMSIHFYTCRHCYLTV